MKKLDVTKWSDFKILNHIYLHQGTGVPVNKKVAKEAVKRRLATPEDVQYRNYE